MSVAFARLTLLTATLFLVACADKPLEVNTNVNCPQPATATLSRPEALPLVPQLPGEEPTLVIGALSETLNEDVRVYGNEVDKRNALIDHGVRFCGWTR